MLLHFTVKVDPALREPECLVLPSETKTNHADGLKAGLMPSFGFGQAGGSALVFRPRYLFAFPILCVQATQPDSHAREV